MLCKGHGLSEMVKQNRFSKKILNRVIKHSLKKTYSYKSETTRHLAFFNCSLWEENVCSHIFFRCILTCFSFVWGFFVFLLSSYKPLIQKFPNALPELVCQRKTAFVFSCAQLCVRCRTTHDSIFTHYYVRIGCHTYINSVKLILHKYVFYLDFWNHD